MFLMGKCVGESVLKLVFHRFTVDFGHGRSVWNIFLP